MHQKMLDHITVVINNGNVAAGFGLGFGIAAIIVWVVAVFVWMRWYRKRQARRKTK